MEPNLGAITYERKAVQTGWIPIARKLAVILHRLLRDGTEFRWSAAQGQAA